MLIFCMDWNVLQGLSYGRKINAAKLTKPYFQFYFEFCEFGNVPFPEKKGGRQKQKRYLQGILTQSVPKEWGLFRKRWQASPKSTAQNTPSEGLKISCAKLPLTSFLFTSVLSAEEGPWREAWLCFRPRYLPLIVTNIGDNQFIWTKGLFHSAHVLGFESMTEKTYCSWTQCHLHRDSLNGQKTPAKHPTFTP